MIETFVQKINALFRSKNFETLEFDRTEQKRNKFCYDLLVKKDDLLFTVKIFANIDNINSSVINDIKALSLLLNSKPILIGLKNRYQKLEDNTIYIREDLPFITFNTLEKIISSNLYPHVLARRGGGVVFLDGHLMKTLREKKNISRKDMSEELGITKRTLCSYENESMRPSELVASKILDLLENGSLFRKVNVFEWNIKFSIDQRDLMDQEELSSFESQLQGVFDDLGVSSYWHKKGQVPFKLTLYSKISDEESVYPIFSGVSEEKKKINETQLKCLSLFTKLFHKNALLIVDNSIRIPDTVFKKKVPIVRIKSLESFEDEDEFIEFIQTKKQ